MASFFTVGGFARFSPRGYNGGKEEGGIGLLSAMMDNGVQLVLTRELSKGSLNQLREDHVFHCPQCHGRMWLRLGDVRIPHFAHEAGAGCRNDFSEGESPEHLAGKQILYDMFTNMGLRTGMETRIPSIGQRPDLLVEKDGRAHAIEFQCSPISRSLINERTGGFTSIGVETHWIPVTPKSWDGMGPAIRTRSLPDFLQSFFRVNGDGGKFLMTFDPLTGHFYYFVHPMHVTGNTFIGKTVVLPYTDQHFPFAVPAKPERREFRHYMRAYAKRRKSYLDRRILISRKGVNDPLLRACYDNGVLIGRLSPYIGVPTLLAGNYSEHSAEWQALFLFHMTAHGAGGKWTDGGMISKFVSKYPAQRGEARPAVEAYARFLSRSGIGSLTELDGLRVLSDESIDLLWDDFLASQSEN